MGQAEGELPLTLIAKYLSLVADQEPLPAAICLYTEGVKLAVKGSPVVAQLRALEEQGVRLILCKTCLDSFGLTGDVEVGEVAGMPEIIDAQWAAERVITL
jgi:sulfur relay (sulfurtransferase) complex TusBCD TusD component (DsrE family)